MHAIADCPCLGGLLPMRETQSVRKRSTLPPRGLSTALEPPGARCLRRPAEAAEVGQPDAPARVAANPCWRVGLQWVYATPLRTALTRRVSEADAIAAFAQQV